MLQKINKDKINTPNEQLTTSSAFSGTEKLKRFNMDRKENKGL